MMDEPVACSLDPADLNARRASLLPGLVARAANREELPGGYRWRFQPADGLLEDLARVLDAERRCCRFLTMVLTIEPAGQGITLDATGPAGTKEFLAALTQAQG